MIHNTERKILVIHGPNMNLLGVRSALLGEHFTLDKINRAMRRHVRNTDTALKILQTHDEARAVTFLQRNRNQASGVILMPGPWRLYAHTLKDTLDLIRIPCVTVSFREDEDDEKTVFGRCHHVREDNPVDAYILALDRMTSILSGSIR